MVKVGRGQTVFNRGIGVDGQVLRPYTLDRPTRRSNILSGEKFFSYFFQLRPPVSAW